MEKILFSVRVLLRKDNLKTTISQIKDIKTYFSDSYILVILCGIYDKKLKDYADKIIYTGKKPKGFTLPLKKGLDFAKNNNFSKIVLIDGDNQFIISEIKRIYNKYKTADIIAPIRKNILLKFKNSKINRKLIEDCENELLKHLNCKIKDPQPGIIILLNKKAINSIKLENIPNMIGDGVLSHQISKSNFKIIQPKIKTRVQKTTNVSIEDGILILLQYINYFNKNMER